MNATFSKTIDTPYLFSMDTASAIFTLLKGKVGEVEISASCEDDITRLFDSVKELEAYENPKGRRIVSIDFTAASECYKKRASISFTESKYYSSISIRATAREDAIIRLRNSFLEIVEHCRPWYSFLHRIDFWVVMLAVSFVVAVTSMILLVFLAGSVSLPRDFKLAGLLKPILGGFVLGGTLIGSTHLLTLTRDRLFPRAMFLVGYEIERHSLLEKWRWSGVIALGVSLVAGIILLIVQLSWT